MAWEWNVPHKLTLWISTLKVRALFWRWWSLGKMRPSWKKRLLEWGLKLTKDFGSSLSSLFPLKQYVNSSPPILTTITTRNHRSKESSSLHHFITLIFYHTIKITDTHLHFKEHALHTCIQIAPVIWQDKIHWLLYNLIQNIKLPCGDNSLWHFSSISLFYFFVSGFCLFD